MIEQDSVKHHAILGAQHGDGGLSIAGENRPPTSTTGDSRNHPALGRLVIDKLRAYIRQCRAMQIDESAGAALAEPEVSANVVDYFSLGLGLYQFFETTS